MFNKTFLTFLMVLSLGGCEKDVKQAEKAPLVVILSPDNPPFEFKDTAQGGDESIGFDVDIVKEVASRLGRPLKIVEADFGAIIPSLQAGRADIAISELYPSEERGKSVDFSDIYHSNPAALLVPQNSLIASEEDLKGKKLGAQLGTVNESLARKWAERISDLSIVSLGKVGELAQELKNGRIDAVLVGGKVASTIAKAMPGFKVVKARTSTGNLVMAFPKGSTLVPEVNQVLKTMKPEIQQLAKKWLSE